jgi:hypothetical protein
MQPILKNATKFGKLIEISFSEMMSLMNTCHDLQTPMLEQNPMARQISRSARRVPRNLLSATYSNSVAIFNGIVPGKIQT